MKTTDLGFAIDLVCALVYIITVPLLLLIVFGPAIARGIQKIQDERDGKSTYTIKPNRLHSFLGRITFKKNKCPRCEFINDPQEEYCKKCGARLKITSIK